MDNNTTESGNGWTLKEWVEKWENGEVDWHHTEVNELLKTHEKRFKEKGRILFPWCSKTVDMKYLRDRGFTVIGIEYNEKLVEQFFRDNDLEFDKFENGHFRTYESVDGGITIHAGDFLRATPELVGRIDGVWDKAALVAVGPRDRRRYADRLVGMMNPDTVHLVVCVSYDQSKRQGPGFSVPMETVVGLYGSECHVERVCEATNDHWMEYYGLDWFLEAVYCLKLKSE